MVRASKENAQARKERHEPNERVRKVPRPSQNSRSRTKERTAMHEDIKSRFRRGRASASRANESLRSSAPFETETTQRRGASHSQPRAWLARETNAGCRARLHACRRSLSAASRIETFSFCRHRVDSVGRLPALLATAPPSHTAEAYDAPIDLSLQLLWSRSRSHDHTATPSISLPLRTSHHILSPTKDSVKHC
jgi:hypothetical protein